MIGDVLVGDQAIAILRQYGKLLVVDPEITHDFERRLQGKGAELERPCTQISAEGLFRQRRTLGWRRSMHGWAQGH